MTRRGPLPACVALIVLLVGVLLAPTAAGAARPQTRDVAVTARVAAPQSPPPKAYIVVDAQTGTVLLADHEHDALPPASTAKVMTALTAVERLPANATINVSPLAAGQPASRINMAAGQQWPFENAMASLLMASANDAAYAIAETAGGSVDGFIAAMQQSGKRLGMKDSTYADPAGLDDKTSYKGGPRMSAYDIAIATRNAMAVPEIAKYAGLRTFKFDDPTGLHRSLTNHNKLLPGSSHAYQWATGFKTGYTERAGHTITATATRDGRSLVAVIMNTYDTYGWAAQLFDQGFAIANDAGTGTRLPRVAVSTYDQRVADRDAFSTLVRGASLTAATRTDSTPTSAAPPASTSSSSTSSSAPATTAAPPSSVVGGSAIASQQSAAGTGGSGVLSVRNVVIVLLILLVIAFMLRRRAVRRQRARRIARQRNRAAKMRSGGLTVVDGRYRPGDRVGPPVESHVRVRRDDE